MSIRLSSPRRRGLPAPRATAAQAFRRLVAPREGTGSSSASRPSREFTHTMQAIGRVASLDAAWRDEP